ncbi:MAG: NAD(P)H-binding protein [Luteitalea sp.]|nr:NAD(P)H-binding protein [Luteitalea sp.]
MVMNDRVLVVGGTRGTGLLITRLLLQRGYRVRVLARDPARAASRLDSAVDVIAGDITKPDTLVPAVQGTSHIIFTAGVHSGRIARERLVKITDYQGVLNTLMAARDAGLGGRFLYMNSIGVTTPSMTARLLNFLKRNTLVWRRHVEDEIRASGLDYTIIRVGFLLNRPSGQRTVDVSQGALPLAPRYRIARADVAEAFVEALPHPRASRATFEVIWGKGHRHQDWSVLLGRLKPDG